jgi:transposase InsO family protein
MHVELCLAREGYPKSVMVHSKQGSQYFSRDFRALLLTNECIKSMSRSIAQYTAHVGIML